MILPSFTGCTGFGQRPNCLWKAGHVLTGGALPFWPTLTQWQILSEAWHQSCAFLRQKLKPSFVVLSWQRLCSTYAGVVTYQLWPPVEAALWVAVLQLVMLFTIANQQNNLISNQQNNLYTWGRCCGLTKELFWLPDIHKRKHLQML